jgi:hypothetical protein
MNMKKIIQDSKSHILPIHDIFDGKSPEEVCHNLMEHINSIKSQKNFIVERINFETTWYNDATDIVMLFYRYETDKEYENRLEREKNHQNKVKQKKLIKEQKEKQQYERLKKKFEG